MKTENDEPTKRHDNTFSLQNVIFIVQVSAVLALSGYWGYPKIIILLEGVNLLFSLVLRNVFFVFIILNALIGSIYFSFLKTTKTKKLDLYDEYHSNLSYQETVPRFQAVKMVYESKCYERVVVETRSKSYRRTTSLEKKKTRSTVKYLRTESERVVKKASWRSQAMDELSSEEFQMKVGTFIMGYKKKMHCQNGVVDQWQEQPDHNGTGRGSHCSRRLVGGSGSTGGSGPYLAISN